MTNKEILDKAISKAKGYPYGCIILSSIIEHKIYQPIIFSHQFAKTFWGSEELANSNGKTIKEFFNDVKEYFIDIEDFEFEWGGEEIPTSYAWQYHLSKMVLTEEPLKYLEKFL